MSAPRSLDRRAERPAQEAGRRAEAALLALLRFVHTQEVGGATVVRIDEIRGYLGDLPEPD